MHVLQPIPLLFLASLRTVVTMRLLDSIDENVSADFMPRRYMRPFLRVIPFYIISLGLIIGTLQFQDWFGTHNTSLLAFGLLTLVALFTFYQIVQSNDLAMASDFQHLLFASAASLGSSFCFFVRRNGTIVYANDATRQMFPKFAYEKTDALDALLEEGDVSAEEQRKIYSALTRGNREQFVLVVHEAESKTQQYIITVDPLKRPSGYFAVHGRPYRAERKGNVKMTGALSYTNLTMLETLLEMLPIGVYLTNATGLIEYANPMLEQMTRYNTQGLSASSMPVPQLIYHADGIETGEFPLQDYSGNVLLSCRNQSLTQVSLKQRALIGKEGKLVGLLGIVTPAG